MNMLTPKLFYCKRNDYYKYMYTLLKDKNFAKKKRNKTFALVYFPIKPLLVVPFNFVLFSVIHFEDLHDLFF